MSKNTRSAGKGLNPHFATPEYRAAKIWEVWERNKKRKERQKNDRKNP